MLLLPAFLCFLASTHTVAAEPSTGSGALYPPGLAPLINHANTLLATGQYNDAVRAYSDAIEQAPVDYLLFYKRATAYLSLSRHQYALQDFDKVLELTHYTFDKALLQKARIYAKEGNWKEAGDNAKAYANRVKSSSANNEATQLVQEIQEGEKSMKTAKQALRAKLYSACVEAAGSAIRVATHSNELRELRAECSFLSGNLHQTVGDLIRLTHLTSPTTAQFQRIANISYFLLPPSGQAQSTIKQCLHLDPDSKPCATAHRQLKKFEKSFEKVELHASKQEWREIITEVYGAPPSAKSNEELPPAGFLAKFETALRESTETLLPPSLPSTFKIENASPRRRILARHLCAAYTKIGQPLKAERWCEALFVPSGLFPIPGEAPQEEGDELDGWIGRGEVFLAKEMYEDAVRVFEKAFEMSGRSSQDILTRLQKAQKLLKQSKQKDYYKVLSVARDADQRTIKKAYRNAAKQAHPDKGGTEARMAAVNEAYEVLSNPELRQRFDNGEDPNDPMAQQGGHAWQQGAGAHPFAQFFQQQQMFQQGARSQSHGQGHQFHFNFGGRENNFGRGGR